MSSALFLYHQAARQAAQRYVRIGVAGALLCLSLLEAARPSAVRIIR